MKAKYIAWTGKIIAVLISIGYNIFYVLTNKKIPTLDEQLSILALAGGIILAISSIDVSLIIKTWIEKKEGR